MRFTPNNEQSFSDNNDKSVGNTRCKMVITCCMTLVVLHDVYIFQSAQKDKSLWDNKIRLKMDNPYKSLQDNKIGKLEVTLYNTRI